MNFAGQTLGTFDSLTSPATKFTVNAVIPLANFNLLDAVDQGATSYSGQIGFTADAAGLGSGQNFGAYIDNIRLQQVTTADHLTLEINQSTGAATLKNLTANPISWNLLDITSPGGSLNASGWSSLADQGADGAGTWQEAGGSSATDLAEASLPGSHTLNAGASLAIGSPFAPGVNIHDVGLKIRKAAGPTTRTYDQNVTYVGPPPVGIAGDYNKNGIVDAADYTVWRDHLGGTFPAGVNEGGISPGVVDAADYTFWKSRFGAISGSGAGSLSGGAVPEPSSFVLCLCGVAATWIARRTRIV